MNNYSISKSSGFQAVNIPFKRDYEIVFHETEPFKLCLNAQADGLSILLFSHGSTVVWKGDFAANYLEGISRKTGREVTYQQFVEMLNTSIVASKTQSSKHIFIDLLCYQDLQLLKARRGQGLKQSNMSSSSVDPQKSKKRYLILTYLEKYNENEMSQSGIKEEIDAENDKTHYPLPLSMVEITN